MKNDDNERIKPDHFLAIVSTRAVAVLPEVHPSNQNLLGVSADALEKYYRTAHSFLDDKKWGDAADAFTFLTFLNPYIHAFWMCLGIAKQSQAKYQDALTAYSMALALNPHDPASLANSFQCASALGEEEFAQYSLNKAIECCGDNPEHADLKAKLLQHHP